jgi:hypothetical protein
LQGRNKSFIALICKFAGKPASAFMTGVVKFFFYSSVSDISRLKTFLEKSKFFF